MEMLFKALKQPEQHTELFHFMEDILQLTNDAEKATLANLPLFFTVHLAGFLGLQMQPAEKDAPFFDLNAGYFSGIRPTHIQYIDEEASLLLNELILSRRPEEAAEIKMSRATRWALLNDLIKYYQLHIQDFGQLKTLPVLHEILS